MPSNKSGSLNGGIIGVANPAKKKVANKISTFTSTGSITTASTTEKVDVTLIAGGAAG